MKRLITFVAVIAAFALASGEAFAQFGIEAGFVNSRYTQKSGDNKVTSDPLNGFNVGLNYDINIVKGLSIQPGISYTFLTDKEQSENIANILKGKMTVSEHYLNVPIRIQYSVEVLRGLKIYAFTGPTFSVGLAGGLKNSDKIEIGNIKAEGGYSYDYFSGKITSGNVPKEVLNMISKYAPTQNRFDILYGVGAGVTLFDIIEVKGGYDWGLLNRLKDTDDARMSRNQFFVSVAFRF